MQIFLSNTQKENQFILEGQEALHCTKVLRKKEGDIINAIDGKGNWYKGILREIKKGNCIVDILEVRTEDWTNKTKIHVVMSLLKQQARFENFVEKAVETGVFSITPFITKRTERNIWRKDRIEKIAISACKQSQRAQFPRINKVAKFSDLIEIAFPKQQKLICAVHEKKKAIEHVYIPNNDVVILIGPEGGFTQEELELAATHHWIPVSLGEQTLRAETAGMMVCQTINTINRFTDTME